MGRKNIRTTKGAAPPAVGALIAWGLVLLVLCILWLAIRAQVVEKKGKAPAKPEPELTWLDWWNGTAQKRIEQRMGTKSALVATFKRTRSKLDMDLFGRLDLESFFLGKDDHIFSTIALASYLGQDTIGTAAVREEVRKARVVQDSLDRRGISLVILYAPTKASYLPEFLPDPYSDMTARPANVLGYVGESKAMGLRHIDLRSWFIAMKPKARYPLFPRYGTHWSYYGECLVADSVIRFVEHTIQQPLPHMAFQGIDLRDTAIVRDADALGRAGLDPLPNRPPLAYPKVGYRMPQEGGPVQGMIIGDSYARGFFYLSVMRSVFNNGLFWYYNNSAVPENPTAPELWELDLEKVIAANRVILVLNNESNLKDLGNGFIDDAYRLFTDREAFLRDRTTQRVFRTHRKAIRKDEMLMDELADRSRSEAVPLDTLVDREARMRAVRGALSAASVP